MVGTAAKQADTAPYAWQLSLRREMVALGRAEEDRFADISAAHSGFVPVTRLLESPYLRDIIGSAGGLQEGDASSDIDMTIAVSRFARQYCGAVSAVALIGLAHGIGIDMSPGRCSVMLTNRELPVLRRRFVAAVDLTGVEVVRCAQRPTSLPVTGPIVPTVDELREYVWSRLFSAHYQQLFRSVRELVPNVAPALLWTSAAEYVGGLSDTAEAHLPRQAAATYLADRQALFDADTLRGMAGPNPLSGRLVWEPVGSDPGRTVQTRQMCCLNYLLPERDGGLCENCPHLPADDRAALVTERSTLPAGSAARPAQRRAQEVGRSRPSYRQRRRQAKSQP